MNKLTSKVEREIIAYCVSLKMAELKQNYDESYIFIHEDQSSALIQVR